jgi:plasmid segregation protein ParM
MNEIGLDIGYSQSKIAYMDKVVKFPTAICYASDSGLMYGDENVYEFEGEKYYVGKEAVSGESFSTTDFKTLYKFAPLILFHVLSKFDEVNLEKPISVKTGLAIVDWDRKDDFIERLREITVNDKTIITEPTLIPQGAGVAIDWVNNSNEGVFPDKLVVLDIGYNTVNLVTFVNGKPSRKDIKGYPGHGVSSVIKPFCNYLESKYKMGFSDQEAIQIFVKGTFKFDGEEDSNVKDYIQDAKSKFVKKLFQSVLTDDKKLLSTADNVVIAGGGAYLLQDTPFPPNVDFCPMPMEFSNVRGFKI